VEARDVTTRAIAAGDRLKGIIRIEPRDRYLFPARRARLTVDLRGQILTGVRWDPMLYPDRVRSGVLTIGVERSRDLEEGEVLRVILANDGVRLE
jgi:hypothetical protein